MKITEWTKWKKGGLAAAVAGAIIVGTLAAAPVAFAQTPTPTAPTGTVTAQTAKTRPEGRGGPRGGPGAQLSVVAKALGIEESALQTELQAGKTISDVAASKGVALSVVSNALLTEEKTRLAQDVTDGKITQAQADERLANASTRINDLLTRTMPAGPGPEGRGGPGGQHGGPGAQLAVVAKALGIEESALQTELQAGKTISDVAASKGVALSVVSNALLTEEKTRLAQDVTDGKITQAQADERLANASTRINDLLTKTMPARPQGGAPGQGGPRGPRQPGTTPAATPGPTA
jgi:hypothetical protein